MPWLRRTFIAGFFVTVPLFITVVTIVWLFGVVDGLTGPLYQRVLGRPVPGLGLLTTALVILLAGALGTNVIGKVKVTTATVFDTGVYLIVVGFVLMVVEAFGDEVVETLGMQVERALVDAAYVDRADDGLDRHVREHRVDGQSC